MAQFRPEASSFGIDEGKESDKEAAATDMVSRIKCEGYNVF